jgi:MtN3 and saliva related transmembrane protein
MSSERVQQAVGWTSSALLVLTIGKQVYKQWQEGKSEGVSSWLFAGQIAASIGFTTYSVLVRDWVFVTTNALMLMNGLVGYFILMKNRKRQALTR